MSVMHTNLPVVSRPSRAMQSAELFQVLFTRKGCSEIPWTRAHLYRDGGF